MTQQTSLHEYIESRKSHIEALKENNVDNETIHMEQVCSNEDCTLAFNVRSTYIIVYNNNVYRMYDPTSGKTTDCDTVDDVMVMLHQVAAIWTSMFNKPPRPWIRMDQQEPPKDITLLFYTDGMFMEIAGNVKGKTIVKGEYKGNGLVYVCDTDAYNVQCRPIAWMPLPALTEVCDE